MSNGNLDRAAVGKAASARATWDDRQLAMMYELRLTGISYTRLGQLLGISCERVRFLVARYAERHGLPDPMQGLAAALLELHGAGSPGDGGDGEVCG